jgi:glycosyltransferase involved in cell wall biosynthesis
VLLDELEQGASGVSVSVLICSYNGKSRITPTLEALAKSVVGFPVEVILVDNNSSDGTSLTAREVWERLGTSLQLRVVHEPQLGLAYARRRGVKEAACEYIVFCDDDNWLAPDYLSVAREILSDPKVGAAGGQAEPVFEGPVPAFAYSHGFGATLGIQAVSSGDIDSGHLWGSGLACRRSDMSTVYRCPVLPLATDRTGVLSAASGEDLEICWALRVMGKSLRYDERLKFRHFVPQQRLQLEYILKQAHGSPWNPQMRRFAAALDIMHRDGRIKSALKSAVWCLMHFYWPAERHYQASRFFAACGWRGMMNGIELKIYDAYKWLRSAGTPSSTRDQKSS